MKRWEDICKPIWAHNYSNLRRVMRFFEKYCAPNVLDGKADEGYTVFCLQGFEMPAGI